MNRHTYLVGMPGSGKSSVGRALAGLLGLPFVDLDQEIERAAGRSIGELFGERGEDGFRDLESRTLAQAASGEPAVVACGGGVVTRLENLEVLASTGTVVYLDVPLERLRQRVRIGGPDRPLLQDEGDLDRLFHEREEQYRRAAAIVVAAEGEPDDVAASIRTEL